MTRARVDFYLLADSGQEFRERFACRLAEKAYKSGHRVLLVAADPAQAARLDELMWTFRQGSFIPHALVEERDIEPVAIAVPGGAPLPENGADEVLVNLTDADLEHWERWPRVAEILDRRDPVVRAGRQRFRAYRDAGVAPHTHELQPAGSTR